METTANTSDMEPCGTDPDKCRGTPPTVVFKTHWDTEKVVGFIVQLFLFAGSIYIFLMAIVFVMFGLKRDRKIRHQVTGVVLFNMAICVVLILIHQGAHIYHAMWSYLDWVSRDEMWTKGQISSILCPAILILTESANHVFPDLLILLSITSLYSRARPCWNNRGTVPTYLIITFLLWGYNTVASTIVMTVFGRIVVYDEAYPRTNWCSWNLEVNNIVERVPRCLVTMCVIIVLTVLTFHNWKKSESERRLTRQAKLKASTKANIFWIFARYPFYMINYFFKFKHISPEYLNFRVVYFLVNVIMQTVFVLATPVVILLIIWNLPSMKYTSFCCACVRAQTDCSDDEDDQDEMNAINEEQKQTDTHETSSTAPREDI